MTRSLSGNERGFALSEFALVLPLLVLLCCTGLELANYVTVRMRVAQVALQLADNAARMGDAVQGVRTVSSANIAETFTGGDLQAGDLDLEANGRVILSSLEPRTSPNTATAPRYRIRWQRCHGDLPAASSWGREGDSNLTGMGPAGRQVTAPDYDATMFVELRYRYRPFFPAAFPADRLEMTDTAAMTVRDPRVLGVAPVGQAPDQAC